MTMLISLIDSITRIMLDILWPMCVTSASDLQCRLQYGDMYSHMYAYASAAVYGVTGFVVLVIVTRIIWKLTR